MIGPGPGGLVDMETGPLGGGCPWAKRGGGHLVCIGLHIGPGIGCFKLIVVDVPCVLFSNGPGGLMGGSGFLVIGSSSLMGGSGFLVIGPSSLNVIPGGMLLNSVGSLGSGGLIDCCLFLGTVVGGPGG